jgi:hypothetical protein
MAASAWEFYNSFKDKLGQGLVDLTGTNTTFRMRLYKSTSNAATATLVSAGQVTNEVDSSAYPAEGKALTVNWSVKTTTSTYSWTYTTVFFTASGTAINNVKYAVIATQTASILVCWSELSTTEFNVALDNTLVIEPNPVAFELN